MSGRIAVGVSGAGSNLRALHAAAVRRELGAEIVRASGAKRLQWVAAGMMVTMDFREDRVRVYLDAQNRVQRASCG